MTELQIAHAQLAREAVYFAALLVAVVASVSLLFLNQPLEEVGWSKFVRALGVAVLMGLVGGGGLGLGAATIIDVPVGSRDTQTAMALGAGYLQRHPDASVEELRTYICAKIKGACDYTVALQREAFLRDETLTLVVGGSWTEVYLLKDPLQRTDEKRYSMQLKR